MTATRNYLFYLHGFVIVDDVRRLRLHSRLPQVRLPGADGESGATVRGRRPAGAQRRHAQGIGDHLHRDAGPRRQHLAGGGATPHYASQGALFPWAYNVPVAVSRVLALPGDIVIVPRKMAADLAAATVAHEEWDEFSRIKLAEGGSIGTYYPPDEQGRRE